MGNWKQEKHIKLIECFVKGEITEQEYLKGREGLGEKYKWREMKYIVKRSDIWQPYFLKLKKYDRLKALIEIYDLTRDEVRKMGGYGGRIDDFFREKKVNQRGISYIAFELAVIMDVAVEYLLYDNENNIYLTPHQNSFLEYKEVAAICDINELCTATLTRPNFREIKGFRLKSEGIGFLNTNEKELYVRLDRRLEYFCLQFYLNSFSSLEHGSLADFYKRNFSKKVKNILFGNAFMRDSYVIAIIGVYQEKYEQDKNYLNFLNDYKVVHRAIEIPY